MLTPISYEDVATLRGCQKGTIHNAITRGVLIPLPRVGVKRYLAKEQVTLFSGKELAKEKLSKNELDEWNAITEEIYAQPQTKPNVRQEATEGEVPQGSPFSIVSYLAAKMKNTSHNDTHAPMAYS